MCFSFPDTSIKITRLGACVYGTECCYVALKVMVLSPVAAHRSSVSGLPVIVTIQRQARGCDWESKGNWVSN